MAKRKYPKCYCGCGKPVKGPFTYFATTKCAADYADQLIDGNQEFFCFNCDEWNEIDIHDGGGCRNCGASKPLEAISW